MIQKIKKSLLHLTVLSLLSVFGFTGVVAAQDSPVQGGVCRGANELKVTTETSTSAQCTDAGADTSEKVNNLITQIINVFSVIVGIIAVIMIIWGGLKYITSGGDSGNVTGAKNTILYAIIGLIIVALSQFIVRFVLSKTAETTA